VTRRVATGGAGSFIKFDKIWLFLPIFDFSGCARIRLVWQNRAIHGVDSVQSDIKEAGGWSGNLVPQLRDDEGAKLAGIVGERRLGDAGRDGLGRG